MVLAAPGRQLVDFGLRRAHGAEAGLLAARASYLAGFDGTATIQAGRDFGIPTVGTMAHSFVQAHDDEATAFERFARVRPKTLTLLIDTYDTERGAALVAALAPRLAADGITVSAVRLDSGDLGAHARAVRAILDSAGLRSIRILASGGLDEQKLLALTRDGAPIDGYGVGTSLTTSEDAPALDCAYKLRNMPEYRDGRNLLEKPHGPGRKQVWRSFGYNGRMTGDVLGLHDDQRTGEPLLVPVMRSGQRLASPPTLADIRQKAAHGLAQLPKSLRRLSNETTFPPVTVAPGLIALAEEVDRRCAAMT